VIPGDVGNLIGGDERPAGSGAWLVKRRPADGEALCRVARSDAADVAAAVSAAREAQVAWGARTVVERGVVVRQTAELLSERREENGRRRRLFSLTEPGREALSEWRSQPSDDPLPELRDPGLLRLFFGAEPQALAATRLEAHRAKLRDYEEQSAYDPGDGPRGVWLALEAGVRHEREWVRFWEELAGAG